MRFDHVVYIDIETVVESATVGMDLSGEPPGYCFEPGEPPANYKSPEAIARWQEREAEKSKANAWRDYAAGALSPMSGRVVCVGVAVDDRDVQTYHGDDETEMLGFVRSVLDQLPGPYRVVGHNLKGFDAPFLMLRGMKWGVRLPLSQAKKWDTKLIDTRELWPCSSGSYGLKGSGKLGDIIRFLGLDFPEDTSGADVFSQYVAGEWETIARHCAIDVEKVRALYRELEHVGLIPRD